MGMGRNVMNVQARIRRLLSSRHVSAIALVAVMALLLIPAGASAASPVLEFVVPGHSLPIDFTTASGPVNAEMENFETLVHCTASSGEGEIIGPRLTVSHYTFTGCATKKVGGGGGVKCKSTSASAGAEEIKTGEIVAELVYIDKAKHEVAMLLNPTGGIYLEFECGGELTIARGSFLAPVSPVNQEAESFTAILTQSKGLQTPDEYETANGEIGMAIPEGSKSGEPFVKTAVEMAATVHSSYPGEIEALTAEEVEAKQNEEAQKKHQEEVKQQEEALNKRHQEEAASKKHEEEVNAQTAAKKYQEEAAAKQHQEEAKKKEEEGKAKSKPPTRTQLLSKALAQCKKQPKSKRTQCEARAEKKYGHKTHKASTLKAGKK
jgi:hypothetical protein